jgi:methionine aminopeptidase
MLERVKERLGSFGYVLKDGDEVILTFSIQKVENTIKNDCNVSSIPDGLANIAIDMAAGEFLTAKKTFSPDDIAGLDLGFAVKQIQEGDTITVFAIGEGTLTSEQRLNNFLNYLLTHGRDEFSSYRRFRW